MNDEMKWELQLFADVDNKEPDEGDNKDPNGGNNPKPEGGEPEKEKTGDKKYTDKDVDSIVEKKFARWKAQHEKELEDAKKEAVKLAKMNEEQKKDYELEKIKSENEKLRAEAARYELGKTATGILKESKIEATQDILDFVVGRDAAETKANIDKFVEVINSQVKAAEIERATGKTPRSYGSNDDNKSEILKRIEKYK